MRRVTKWSLTARTPGVASAAILMAWHPGSEGGLAVARLLFGDATPGGKLPFSWPRSGGQLPLIYARRTAHQPPTSHQRYWEEESTPLYPFGFGLTCGQVEYRTLTLSSTQIGHDDAVVTVLAFIAILLASINVFGGFAVTRRMLGMFTRG